MEYPQFEGLDLKQLAQEMVRLKKLHAAMKDETTAKWREFEHVAMRLIPDIMDEMGVAEITYPDVGKITISETLYASIPPENKDEIYEWLRESGYADLIGETVNSSTMSAQVRRWIQDAEDYPADLINHNNKRIAKVK